MKAHTYSGALPPGNWRISKKYDGIHATLFIDPTDEKPKFYSLTGKVLPNKYLLGIAQTLSEEGLLGWEFEIVQTNLLTGMDANFNEIQSFVMSQSALPKEELDLGFIALYKYGQAITPTDSVTISSANPLVKTQDGLTFYSHPVEQLDASTKATALQDPKNGNEGYMLTDVGSTYEHRRSHHILKFKFKTVTDAKIVSWVPLERKDGTQDWSQLGALHCVALDGNSKGIPFKVGTGFTENQRKDLAEHCHHFGLASYFVEIEHMPVALGKAPRQPVFLKIRHLSERSK
jgi:ATP-dependent DNA ligase